MKKLLLSSGLIAPLLLPMRAADIKISDLTAITSPSTNTWTLVSDMNAAAPKSRKILWSDLAVFLGNYLFTNTADVTAPWTFSAGVTFSSVTNNIIAQNLGSQVITNDTADAHRVGTARNLRSVIAAMEQGTTATGNILWLSDSWGNNGRITTPIITALQRRYGEAGPGWCQLVDSSLSTRPPNVTLTRAGTWTDTEASRESLGLDYATSTDIATPASILITATNDQWVIYWKTNSHQGVFRYQVNGGTWTNITATSATKDFETITGGTLGSANTLKLEMVTAGDSGVTLYGVDLRSSVSGIRLHQLGTSGRMMNQFADASTNATWRHQATNTGCSLVVIQLGTNDKIHNVSPTDEAASLLALITSFKTILTNCDILVFPSTDNGVAGTWTMQNYRDAQKGVALANGCMFLDAYADIGDYATANDLGLYVNPAHVSDSGGRLLADLFLKAMRLDGSESGGVTGVPSSRTFTVATLPVNPALDQVEHCSDCLTPDGTGKRVQWSGSEWRVQPYGMRATTNIQTYMFDCMRKGLSVSGSIEQSHFLDQFSAGPTLDPSVGAIWTGYHNTGGSIGGAAPYNVTSGNSTLRLNTGTASTGYSAIYGNYHRSSNGYLLLAGRSWFDTLPDGAQNYWGGMFVASTSGTDYGAAMGGLLYDPYVAFSGVSGTQTNNLLNVTRVASAQTVTDTGFAPVAGTAFLWAVYSPSGGLSQVVFTNGVAACTNSAHMPVATTIYVPSILITKTLGGTARSFYHDWIYIHERNNTAEVFWP